MPALAAESFQTEAAILRCAQDAKSWTDLAEAARLIAMLAHETTASQTG